MTITNNDAVLDMVLTSIVNNRSILNSIASDVNERFKVKLNEQDLENYLNVIEVRKNK
jgi:hypothetical protein